MEKEILKNKIQEVSYIEIISGNEITKEGFDFDDIKSACEWLKSRVDLKVLHELIEEAFEDIYNDK